MPKKLIYESVKNIFKERGCELLSNEYINNKSKLKYKCNCGNISEIRFDNFIQGQKCMICSGKIKYTYEYMKQFFTDNNCKLLETNYINNSSLMKYMCSCNNQSEIRFSDFKNGVRCQKCSLSRGSKISKYFKNYTLPSGNIIRIQGYENIALDELIKKYKEQDIFTNRDDVPKILYQLKNKQHRYYPDIYIKSENKIIEVKSTWTYKKSLIKNILKALATRKLGYDFEFWIYHPDKKDFKKIIV